MINLRVPLTLLLVWAAASCLVWAFVKPLPEGAVWLVVAIFAADTARVTWRDGFWL